MPFSVFCFGAGVILTFCQNRPVRSMTQRRSDILSEQNGAVSDTMSMFSTLFAVLKTHGERC